MSKRFTDYLSKYSAMLMVAVLALVGTQAALAAGDDDEPKAPQPTMVPAYDSELTEVSTITLDFGTPVQAATNQEPITVAANGSVKNNVSVSVTYSGNIATATLSPAFNEKADVFTVIFREGYFYFPELGITSDEVYCRYSIKGSSIANYVSVTPANGSTLTSLSTVEIQFQNGDVFDGNSVRSTLKFNDGDSEIISDYVTRGGFFGENYGLIDFVNPIDDTPAHGAYTADGTYVIKIPQGRWNIRINGALTPSQAIELTYYIGEGGGAVTPSGNVPATITPADGSTVTEISEITLNWGNTNVFFGTGDATITCDGAAAGVITQDEVGRDFDWVNSTITLTTPKTEPGEYVISFPAGFFKVGSMGNTTDSDAFTITYTIEGGAVTPSGNVPATITPEDGSTVTEISEIVLNWGNTNVFFGTGDATITCDGAAAGVITQDEVGRDFDWVISTITLATPKTEPGEYVISFPAGFFKVGSMGNTTDSDAFTITYTIEGGAVTPSGNVPATITPEDGSTVTEISEITLNWGDTNVFWGTGEATITCDGAAAGVITQDDVERDFSWENSTITFTTPITEPGEYVISFPAGFFKVGSMGNTTDSDAFTITYTIEGEAEVVPVAPGTVNPVNGSEVEELTDISVAWAGATTYMPSNEALAKELVGTLAYNGTKTADLIFDQQIKMTLRPTLSFTIKLGDLASEPGKYTITIPQAFINVTTAEGTFPNAEFVLEYTVLSQEPGPGEIEPQPLESYVFQGGKGTYSEISNGTVVLNYSIFDSLIDDGLAGEDFEIKSLVAGKGQLLPGTYPGQPSSLPGIPFGFEFPYAGQTFSHFLIDCNGAIILGGETIGNFPEPSQINDGPMGRYVFMTMSNVLGSIPLWTPSCLQNTEISYVADASGVTVQYKNLGYRKTMNANAVPVSFQVKMAANGTVTIVYSGWDAIEASGDEYSSEWGKLYVALKGEKNLISLEGDLVEAKLNYNLETPTEVEVYPTLPNGYTVTFGASQEECEAPTVSGTLTLETSSTTLNAVLETSSGTADGYLFVLSESFMMGGPEDGKKYEVGDVIDNMGGQMKVVSVGDAKEVFIEGLTPSTRYYVGVWPYNSVGKGAPVYMVSYGFPPFNKSEMTMPAGPASMSVTACDLNSLTLSVTGNEDGDDVIIVRAPELTRDNNIADVPVVGDFNPYMVYEVGDEIEGGGVVVYIGEPKEGIVVSDLDNSTPYHFAAFTYNDYGGYVEFSSDAVYASGSTVVLPPYDMDFSLERRFVAPAGWTAEWTNDAPDGFAVWSKATMADPNPTYYLRFCLGGVEPSNPVNAWFVTSPIAVEKTGYVATMTFNGEIYPTNPRDPAGPLSLAEGDFISLSVSKDGGETFTEAMKYTKENFESTYQSVDIEADLSAYADETVQLKFEWRTSVLSGDGSGGSQLYVTSYTIEEGSDSSGVANLVNAEEGVYRVYTISGIRVLETENAADLGNLASGLYIINGKKVIIK